MKKHFNIYALVNVIIFFILFENTFGQTTFYKTFGDSGKYEDKGYSVVVAHDGGYVVAGESDFYSTETIPYIQFGNIFLLKTDTSGDTVWTKTYRFDERSVAYSLDTTNDGGYIVSGYRQNYGLWVIKTDENGDSLWTKTYELGGARSIQQTNDSGYIITGGGANGEPDIFLLKTNESGDSLWLKTFDTNQNVDKGRFVEQTSDGGFVIAGTTEFNDTNFIDIWIIKTDSLGNVVWSKIYGRPETDLAFTVCETQDGGFFVTGSTMEYGTTGLEPKIWLLRMDSVGDTLWTRTIRNSPSDVAFSGIQTFDGSFITVGYTVSNTHFDSNIYINKLDSEGNILWSNEIGNTYDYKYRGYDIAETKDMGYIITGYQAIGNYANIDLFLLKVDNNGQLTNINEFTTSSPRNYKLFQNYPNPFNSSTKIVYSLSESSHIYLKIYDILGRDILTVVNKYQAHGTYEITLNLLAHNVDISSGIYFYSLQVGNTKTLKKMIFIK